MTEIMTVAGPLDAERLTWISQLYGRVDPKYRRNDVLEHLFTATPEPSLHSFALDGVSAVGHCCVVPTPGRLGPRTLRAGKLEALFVEQSHRGRRGVEEPVVATLLRRLYEFADQEGIELIHALATPEIGRVIRFARLDGVGERSHVAIAAGATPRSRALSAAQGTLRMLAALATPAAYALRPPTEHDVDLVRSASAPEDRWTLPPGDAWSWYARSPLLRVLELEEGERVRALVQVPGAPGEAFRLVGWRPERVATRGALALLRAAARAARASGAATLRFQPWPSPVANGALERACRLAGFVRRPDLTTVWVRTALPELARTEAIVPSPSLYLAF